MFVVIHEHRNFIHPVLWDKVAIHGPFSSLPKAFDYMDKLESPYGTDLTHRFTIKDLVAPPPQPISKEDVMSFIKVVRMLTRFERSPLNKKLGLFIRQAARMNTLCAVEALTKVLTRLSTKVVDRAVE